MKTYAAGIVPYFVKHNECYILIGKDRMSKKWSGFSGSREDTDLNVIKTALREFNEETACIFDLNYFEQKLMNKQYTLLKSETPKGNDYYNFFIEIEHNFSMDHFPRMFLEKVDTFEEYIYREKMYIRWTKISELIINDLSKKTFVITNNFLKDLFYFYDIFNGKVKHINPVLV